MTWEMFNKKSVFFFEENKGISSILVCKIATIICLIKYWSLSFRCYLEQLCEKKNFQALKNLQKKYIHVVINLFIY